VGKNDSHTSIITNRNAAPELAAAPAAPFRPWGGRVHVKRQTGKAAKRAQKDQHLYPNYPAEFACAEAFGIGLSCPAEVNTSQ
jgi:hypothetical protein